MILITGGSGNVGKEVLKQMAQTGAQVGAFLSLNEAPALSPGVEIVALDYNQPEDVRAWMIANEAPCGMR